MAVHYYPFTVQEVYLDSFGHVNNAVYLTLYEQARWDLITKNGYGVQKIRESGYGPVLLELKVKFLKELNFRDQVMIETETLPFQGKIGKMAQRMMRNGVVCSEAEFIFALFSLAERKLVQPTEEWLRAIEIAQS